jgi:hypothetical protein
LAEEVKNHYQSVDYHVTGIVQTVSGEIGAGHVSKLLRKISFHCTFAGVFAGNGAGILF